jgi:hypothetical protein
MPTCDLSDLEQFITKATEFGLTTAVIAWKDEYGQLPQDMNSTEHPDKVVYDRLAQIVILGYHRASSTIVRCTVDGGQTERLAISERLRQHGFAVELRTRNEIKYRT